MNTYNELYKTEKYCVFCMYLFIHKSQISAYYLVADRFEVGLKQVADLQRAEIWPII